MFNPKVTLSSASTFDHCTARATKHLPTEVSVGAVEKG
jgi:hypothetical protein